VSRKLFDEFCGTVSAKFWRWRQPELKGCHSIDINAHRVKAIEIEPSQIETYVEKKKVQIVKLTVQLEPNEYGKEREIVFTIFGVAGEKIAIKNQGFEIAQQEDPK
jgi:hypothetical protein